MSVCETPPPSSSSDKPPRFSKLQQSSAEDSPPASMLLPRNHVRGLGREGQKVIYIKSDSTSTSATSSATSSRSATPSLSSGQVTPTLREPPVQPPPSSSSSSAARRDSSLNKDNMHANLQAEFLKSVRTPQKQLYITSVTSFLNHVITPYKRPKRPAKSRLLMLGQYCSIPEENGDDLLGGSGARSMDSAELSEFKLNLEGVLLAMLPREERTKRGGGGGSKKGGGIRKWSDVRPVKACLLWALGRFLI